MSGNREIQIVRNIATIDSGTLHETLSRFEAYHQIVRKDSNSGSPPLFSCQDGKVLILDISRRDFSGELHYGNCMIDRGLFDKKWIPLIARHVISGELLMDLGDEFFRVVTNAAWGCKPQNLRTGGWQPIPVPIVSNEGARRSDGKGRKERIAA